MEREKRFSIRVGVFVALGLALLAVIVFVLGGDRGLFSRHVRYTASFESIDGLKPGSPVRLAGVEIGQVTRIAFYPDPRDRRVQVTLDMLASYADRIRTDSTASVGSRGVLGDKVVDLSIGSPEQPTIAPGGEIPVGSSSDYTEIVKKGAEVIDNTLAITSDLRQLVSSYNTPTMREGIGEMIEYTRDILREVRTGDGALHALLFDPASGKQMRELLANASSMAKQADAAIGRLDAVIAQVQKGDGMIGAMLYDKSGKQVVHDLGVAANEISKLAAAVRTEKDGLLHGLFYGAEDGPNLNAELGAAARDLRSILAKINEGDGSLGALINDPTVYEDFKTILGNVKRNRILRELVRYSISKQDQIERYGKKE
ncbi:MlaD family protein [Vulgatibacter incomptus]|uniref:Putative ABC transporter, periplasmic component YrbD n=1 Tax=Vulgatibacter incomptus TaxID=1391653 RepID=A0A0K1PAH1_9BACT|nr:MlaD family protein [Vulgatibacter incomptus]AKU90515.1 putative ABC transporter, periplasmic component YrbD [Vulgatibacter incomptus]